jgi:hypothetical protein
MGLKMGMPKDRELEKDRKITCRDFIEGACELRHGEREHQQ